MRVRTTIAKVEVEIQLPPREPTIFARGQPPKTTDLVWRKFVGKVGGRHGTWYVGTPDGVLYVTMLAIPVREHEVTLRMEPGDGQPETETVAAKFANIDQALQAAIDIGGALKPVIYQWRWDAGRPWPNRAAVIIDVAELKQRADDGVEGYTLEA